MLVKFTIISIDSIGGSHSFDMDHHIDEKDVDIRHFEMAKKYPSSNVNAQWGEGNFIWGMSIDDMVKEGYDLIEYEKNLRLEENK